MMILDQNVPFCHRSMHAAPNALAPFLTLTRLVVRSNA